MFNGFTQKDFDVFKIDGLEARMKGIQTHIQPKFQALADEVAPSLSALAGDEFFTHIAQHARRKVNPPNDTWVAFAANKRGYKMMPHFQVGLYESHLFVWFAVIYEAQVKPTLANQLLTDVSKWKRTIPEEFSWSLDHMKPSSFDHRDLSEEDLSSMFTRLRDVKKAELLCGITIDRNDPILHDGNKLLSKIEHTFKTVMPLYQEAQQASIPSS
ncbi:YktB family protein [Alkalicoccobacillus murimartini]|uniref:UPF0637 protein J2S05_001268 n=1 Tax=Alkalicoccobacillus murimartini TaxID=171685 RepID=A0ABT9YF75_9BACI|nr:DUF1054 domain-containing protein [Alkalicoccobacillus murimartini]MDQ0206494.1 uncharacterized protein YktB (UPF0637 family) [Alkalicoccobacillus murimartini]